MCLPLHQRAKGFQISPYLPHLIGDSSNMQSLELEKVLIILLLTLDLFMRLMQIKQNAANVACKWLFF